MFDAARAKPEQLTLASVGPASTQHIAFEMLKHLAGVDMIFVPFNGNGLVPCRSDFDWLNRVST
jgi:tripartite-type tricarboxylate transporter receptor subunit TctC